MCIISIYAIRSIHQPRCSACGGNRQALLLEGATAETYQFMVARSVRGGIVTVASLGQTLFLNLTRHLVLVCKLLSR
jgi:hypothetical protein